MANDIGTFFEAEPDKAEAARSVANHLRRFWDPRMRRQIVAHYRRWRAGPERRDSLGDRAACGRDLIARPGRCGHRKMNKRKAAPMHSGSKGPDADSFRAVDITRVCGGARTPEVDRAATEEPLEVRLHGRPFAVVMRTPGADRELAAGFLLSERVLRTSDDLGTIAHCTDRGRRPSREHHQCDADGHRGVRDRSRVRGAPERHDERVVRHVRTADD